MSDQEPATKKPMSDSHKAALAEGRSQGHAIRRYLEALEANRPKRGRKRTREGISKRLQAIEGQTNDASPLKRVQLIQERMDLEAELAAKEDETNLDTLEADFIAYAKTYSDRKKISYAAWRKLGVPAATLKAAGIMRSA